MKIAVKEEEVLTDNLRSLHYLCKSFFISKITANIRWIIWWRRQIFWNESLNDVRNDLWDNAKFETDYHKPLTSLTDKAENTIEVIPKVKEKTKPEEITVSDELSKVFPEANEKIVEQEEKITDWPLNNLEEIFSKTDKG